MMKFMSGNRSVKEMANSVSISFMSKPNLFKCIFVISDSVSFDVMKNERIKFNYLAHSNEFHRFPTLLADLIYM